MPQLPTFTANLAGNPINSGRAAGAEDFTSIGDAGAGIRQAAHTFQQDKEDDESRKALIGSTQVRAKYAKIMDEATLSGANLDDIKAKMDDELSAIGTQFSTKRGVDSLDYYTANSEIMFQQKSNEIKVTRATVNARLDAGRFLNSAGAIIQSNPAYLAVAEKDAEHLAASWGGTTAEKRLEIADGLKKDLNMAAAIASARLEPKATKDALQGGKWDLTPEQRNTAENFAHTRENEAYADESRKRAQEQYDIRKRDVDAQNDHISKIIKGKATDGAISDDHNLEPDSKRALISFKAAYAERIRTADRRDNQVVMDKLYYQIRTGQMFNNNEIMEQFRIGNLSIPGAERLNMAVANLADENGRKLGSRLEAQVTTVRRALQADYAFTGQGDVQSEILNDYRDRVGQQVEQMRKEDVDPAQALDSRSKYYIGSPAFIAESVKNVRQDRAARAGATLPVLKDKAEYDKFPGGDYQDANGVKGYKPPKGAGKPSGVDPARLRSGGTPG